MKIIALELSTARGSIAALNEDIDPSTTLRTSVARDWANDRKHSGEFFENLQRITTELGAPERIIVGLGPGSYAGVRIAISAAIGLSMTGGTGSVPSDENKIMGRHGGRPSIELVGYPSICALESEAGEYYAVGDARRQSFFFAQVRDHELIEGPTLLSEAELNQKLDTIEPNMSILCSEPLPQFERAVVRYPSAKLLARIAQDPKRQFALPPLEPLYLREPHITVPRSTTEPAGAERRRREGPRGLTRREPS